MGVSENKGYRNLGSFFPGPSIYPLKTLNTLNLGLYIPLFEGTWRVLVIRILLF